MNRDPDPGEGPRVPSGRKARPRKAKSTPAAPADPFRSVTMWVGRPRAFEAEGGGRLLVDKGQVAVSFRLRRIPSPSGGEPADVASCVVRLADAAGAVWESESVFSLGVFIENMINLDRPSWLVYAADAEEWKGIFDGDLMLAGASCVCDDRFYRKFLVGDEKVELKFKYQYPRFDVAFFRSPHLADLTTLVVRVSGLYNLDMVEIRPLAFEMYWHELFFRNELYFDEEEGGWTGDGWPLPVAFRKVDAAGTPQALVRHEAAS